MKKKLFLIIFILVFNNPFLFAENLVAKRVYNNNVEEFKEVLPKNLYNFISSSKFELLTLNKFPEEIKSNDNYFKKISNSNSKEELPEFNALKAGLVANFLEEMRQREAFSDANLDLFLYKILAKKSSNQYIKEKIRLRVVSEKNSFQDIELESITYSPAARSVADKTVQVYKNKFKILKPEILKNYRFLHYNFITNDEDALWIYSPHLNNRRSLTGTNLYDDFLGTTLNLNQIKDFYIKPSKTELTSVKEKEILQAYVKPLVFSTVERDSCLSLSNSSRKIWNMDTKNFPGANEYLLSNVYFYKRKTLELELSIKDVFSKVSRQIIYIDAEFGHPVMYSNYSRDEGLKYFKIPIYGFLKTKNSYTPVMLNSLGVDYKNDAIQLLDKSSVLICPKVSKDLLGEVKALSEKEF